MLKVCKRCKRELEKDIYFPLKGANCKKCRNAINREKYDPEKERIRQERKKEKYGEKLKEQNKKAVIKYRNNNREKLRAKWRKYYHDKKKNGLLNIKYNSKKSVSWVRRWQKNNPEKVKASYLVRKALRKGDLIKSEYCQICGVRDEKLEAHHHNYNEPLFVIWCCRMCHCLQDRFRRTQEEMKHI